MQRQHTRLHTKPGSQQQDGETAAIGDAGRDIDKQQIEALKKLYGFDKPVHVRYWEMLKGFARFDLGRSFMHNKDVWQLIKDKLPVSISLGLWSFLLAYLVSVPLGVAKAVREGSRFDTITTLLVLVGYAIPGFVLGILLIVLFAGGSFLDWFPLRGLTSDDWDEMAWGARIAEHLNAQLAHESAPVVVNLASQEYFKAVERKVLRARVVECVFEDLKGGSYKIVSFYAKRARGLMARWAIQQRAQAPQQLQGFDLDGYAWCASVSTPDRLVFRRDTPTASDA